MNSESGEADLSNGFHRNLPLDVARDLTDEENG